MLHGELGATPTRHFVGSTSAYAQRAAKMLLAQVDVILRNLHGE